MMPSQKIKMVAEYVKNKKKNRRHFDFFALVLFLTRNSTTTYQKCKHFI
jgi:hypothetical protein